MLDRAREKAVAQGRLEIGDKFLQNARLFDSDFGFNFRCRRGYFGCGFQSRRSYFAGGRVLERNGDLFCAQVRAGDVLGCNFLDGIGNT